MGTGFSGLVTDKTGSSTSAINSSKPGLGDLPENCVALILSFLEPSEICKFSCLNKTFLLASLSDAVWEPKLPENHSILVKKLFGDQSLEVFSTKRKIYDRLSNPIHFDDHTKEVWLDKKRGGICVAISWKGLKITGIDDRRYWSHVSTDESRFHTTAYLQQIWWLEVEGNLELVFPTGTYSLFFRLQLGRPKRVVKGPRVTCNVNGEKIHGWNLKPVQFQLASSNGQHAKTECFLEEQGKWIYHHVGDFVVENSNSPTKIKFSMTQIDCTHTKGPLVPAQGGIDVTGGKEASNEPPEPGPSTILVSSFIFNDIDYV